jgi:peptide/nickel transport system substrate-binding protein
VSTMSWSHRYSGLLIVSGLLLLQLCSTPAVSSTTSGMEFVMAYGSDLGELNPVFWTSERSHWYDMLVYDTLLSSDDNMSPIPWLAEAFSVSSDGLTVTFDIRNGALWHDGEPLTAEDVKFTFEYVRDGRSDAHGWSLLQHVTSVTIASSIVTVTLDQALTFALEMLGAIYILPKHIREGVAVDDARWEDEDNVSAQTGSGPFKFVERVPDEYTILQKNEDWWGLGNPFVGQLPNIDTVRIEVILGQDARILAMRNGEADSERYELFGAYVNEALSYPELQLVQGVPSQWDYVWGFNMTVPGLDDLNVRQALSLAINRTELINIGRLGYGTRTDSVIPEAFYPQYFDYDAIYSENSTAANTILDTAGYLDLDADDTRNFPGDINTELEFDLLALSWDDISVATATAIKMQMEVIGVDINVLVTDDWPMYDAIYAGEYEMYTMAHGYDTIPDHIWWRCHSSNIFEWGDNVYHLDNATVDTILDDFISSTPATIAENAAAAAKAISENIPYVPLFLSDDTHAIRAEWVNYTTPPGGPFTSYNPRTMVFMYDSTYEPTSTSTTTTSTTTDTTSIATTSSTSTTDNTLPQGNTALTQIISVGSLIVIVIVVVLICRNKRD